MVKYFYREGKRKILSWFQIGHIMIWMQMSYRKDVRRATTSQTGYAWNPVAGRSRAIASKF
ncbi:MAG: hypothetical protein JRG74_06455 [Deltaproteobacteria bacterium]|nr:hypothetical protein [Deltaproteobacteria bacterium]MBW2165736.1 hypothetical protein [Deltaproteobacteria bacterium]